MRNLRLSRQKISRDAFLYAGVKAQGAIGKKAASEQRLFTLSQPFSERDARKRTLLLRVLSIVTTVGWCVVQLGALVGRRAWPLLRSATAD
ncbi:hypothetical protein ACKI2N_012750 [Cupriavidus sp. 30B13]|uniref:hypothetical protein n=1 Tax=Cupriavidus sp. 30B13 TaxID=3384241 RepID=UPI003B8FA056